MIAVLLFLILFALLFPKALKFLLALAFISGMVILGEAHAEPSLSLRTAEKWCSTHPDARESGDDDEHLISINDCAIRIVFDPSKKDKDFAIRTVTAWKLAARECNIDNLKSRACIRQESLDKALTAYGCSVEMAMWKCPILPGKRSP